MPEVCEVCLTAQYLNSITGFYLTEIQVLKGRYLKKPIKGIDCIKFPLKLTSINTKGKFMWFELSRNDDIFYMLNTFGLTGKWSLEEIEGSHVKFEFQGSTKSHTLYFNDVRNFGTIEFTKDIKILNKKLDKLAVDLLQTSLSNSEFRTIVDSLKNKKKKIVVVLMSQEAKSGIGSGLGNYLVPEILYRAKLSPHRTISSLTKLDMSALNKSIKYQLRLCYMTNTTDYVSHLDKFLKSHRKKVDDGKFPNYHSDVKIGKEIFQFNVYRRKFDDNDNPVVGEIIIPGRTTYWVPNVQV
jgi:formamidopyrimidine-DNA glycosylase